MRDTVGHYGSRNGVGLDVLSVDITRGRDHGIAPYHTYLEKLTSKKINEWSDYLGQLSHNVN